MLCWAQVMLWCAVRRSCCGVLCAGHAVLCCAQVMLCDVTSGGFTHTLTGHTAPVWAVHWSLQTEWHLVTGGWVGVGAYNPSRAVL